MKCGFYEFEITPALGCIIPGAFGARYATDVRDRLYVRACVFHDGNKAAAVAVIDACGITLELTERIRQRVGQFVPLAPESIMVMATHCHGGGPTLTWGEQVVPDPAYLDLLVQKTADAIILSYQKAQESAVILGKGELNGYSFVRVYHMKDGGLRTNPPAKTEEDRAKIGRPTTQVDPEVLVLAVKAGDRYVGAVVNYANHPAIVANTDISGDYISQLCRSMKEYYGPDFVTVFINGACGNINHINPFDPETKAPYRERMIGKALADAVVGIVKQAKPLNSETVDFAQTEITANLRKPDAKALAEAKEIFEGLGDGLIHSIPNTKDYMKTFYALQAFQIMADKRTQCQLLLQILRIGDCFIAGTPTQLFVQYGNQIKAEIGGPCMVSAFANDYRGYVPMPECIGDWGVYEARLAPTSGLAADTGDRVVAGVLELARRLDSFL